MRFLRLKSPAGSILMGSLAGFWREAQGPPEEIRDPKKVDPRIPTRQGLMLPIFGFQGDRKNGIISQNAQSEIQT
jgi:hypothetical protein